MTNPSGPDAPLPGRAADSAPAAARGNAAGEGRAARAGWARWGPLLLFALLGVAQLAGAWRDWRNLGARDWNVVSGQLLAEVTTLQRFGQFPLWNPWRTGGQVSFAQPESMFLSPVMPVALLFGVLPAFKLLLLPVFLLGCAGLHRLARELGLSGAAALTPPLVFFGSAIFPLYVAGGLPNWVFGLALLPWFLWSLQRATADPRWIPVAGLLWAAFLLCGDIFHFTFLPVLAGLWVSALAVQRRSVRPLLVLGAALLVGACLASIRLAPLYDVFELFPRRLAAQDRYLSPGLLLRVLVDPRRPDLRSIAGSFASDGGLTVYWADCGAFLGPLVLLAAAWGAVRRWRRAAAPIACCLAFGWMSLGAGVAFSLWSTLHALPVLHSMQAPERLVVYVAFGLALLAGFGVEALGPRWRTRAGASVLLALLVLPLAAFNSGISGTAFIVEPTPDLPPFGEFRQTPHARHAEVWGAEQYENVLSNLGNPRGGADIPTPQATRPDTSPSYRGEVYLQDEHGTVDAARLTPNLIRVSATLTGDDRLVVNQNHFPGWVATVTGATVVHAEPFEDLVSFPLPAGRHELELRFEQPSVGRGALISLAAALVAGAWLVVDRRRARGRSPLAAHDVAALAACGALLAVLGFPRGGGEIDSRSSPAAGVPGRRLIVAADAPVPGDGLHFATIQAALEAAVPDDVVLVQPGAYDGFRLDKGVTVAPATPGTVTLRTPIVVWHVPRGQRALVIGFSPPGHGVLPPVSVRRCEGVVYLQSLRLQAAPGQAALVCDRCERVLLLDSRLGDRATGTDGRIELGASTLVASRSAIAMTSPAAGIDARRSLLLLNDTAVPGERGIRLRQAQLVSSSASDVALGGLLLARNSRAVVSGTALADGAVSCDATSRLERPAAALPRLQLTARPELHALDVRAFAPPGSTGVLLLGFTTTMQPIADELNLLQTQLTERNVSQPLVFDANGMAVLRAAIPPGQLQPGKGCFAQVVLQNSLVSYEARFSLLDGWLFEPTGKD